MKNKGSHLEGLARSIYFQFPEGDRTRNDNEGGQG